MGDRGLSSVEGEGDKVDGDRMPIVVLDQDHPVAVPGIVGTAAQESEMSGCGIAMEIELRGVVQRDVGHAAILGRFSSVLELACGAAPDLRYQ